MQVESGLCLICLICLVLIRRAYVGVAQWRITMDVNPAQMAPTSAGICFAPVQEGEVVSDHDISCLPVMCVAHSRIIEGGSEAA